MILMKCGITANGAAACLWWLFIPLSSGSPSQNMKEEENRDEGVLAVIGDFPTNTEERKHNTTH